MMHLWLRAESKPNELRVALTPEVVVKLITAGYTISVEECNKRVFEIEQYRKAGCRIVATASWQNAPDECYVIGLKELPEPLPSLHHKHIYFAHAFKNQSGWQKLLSKFADDGGQLLDLEFLLDESKRRIAAFGYWAGFAGAAVAVMNWLSQPGQMQVISDYADKSQLITELSDLLHKHGKRPKAIIIGAKGRCGSGAAEVFRLLNIDVTLWDMEETGKGGPFAEILEHDIFVNCVFVQSDTLPFLTKKLLEQSRILSTIVDVSCDPHGSYNPLPIYDRCTSFDLPAQRLKSEPVLDLISIDHLPSMLPKESSEDYSLQLLQALLQLPDGPTWQGALQVFEEKKAQAIKS
jgi:saccharopine dehydrogenase (NAD+, L-lysine forming)